MRTETVGAPCFIPQMKGNIILSFNGSTVILANAGMTAEDSRTGRTEQLSALKLIGGSCHPDEDTT